MHNAEKRWMLIVYNGRKETFLQPSQMDVMWKLKDAWITIIVVCNFSKLGPSVY